MSLAVPSRRRFLFGAGATLLAAPAIVHVASLMPVSVPKLIVPPKPTIIGAPHGLQVGDYITIDFGPDGTPNWYKGTWQVVAGTDGDLTFAGSNETSGKKVG